MKEVTIIGVGLAKNVFQLHGAAADGSVVFRKKTDAGSISQVHVGSSCLHCGHGGLRQFASLGARDDPAGS